MNETIKHFEIKEARVPNHTESTHTATRNACKLCTPLGAALVFKGIENAVPLLHGSQGCSTYIRRYLISHFKEPIDIACSNFAEETAVFGGGFNLKTALDNIRSQYDPSLIGIATTCLSETIGDDVPMFLKEYIRAHSHENATLPHLVQVSTPSYQGTHMEGFHAAVRAVVTTLADAAMPASGQLNIFPGMVSPADMRYLKEILDDFGMPHMMLPDYSRTLDGVLWREYERIPVGGTPVSAIQGAGNAHAAVEFGHTLAGQSQSAAQWLADTFGIPCHRIGLPMGVNATDAFFKLLESISGKATPAKHQEERGRLIDSYADGHKYVMGAKAVVYGEEDLVLGIVGFLNEIGVVPVVCATGGRSGFFRQCVSGLMEKAGTITPREKIHIVDNVDYVDIERLAAGTEPDFVIGSSKGFAMARRLSLPMVRVGFPVHDRVGGPRLLHLGYRGAQALFDRIANTLIAERQAASSVGYTYM